MKEKSSPDFMRYIISPLAMGRGSALARRSEIRSPADFRWMDSPADYIGSSAPNIRSDIATSVASRGQSVPEELLSVALGQGSLVS